MEQKLEKCIVCGVFYGTGKLEDSDPESLEELKALCEASGAVVVGEITQNREAPDSRTVIGKGKIEELKNAILELDANLVVFDCELSGSHTRNIEEELNARVIDRSRLILDIFALRATTREGKCQVELAQLLYHLPRLSGIGTSLSRLGGGIGTRGPGETQLETDKRHIRERISNLRNELKEIEKNRETQRKQRTKNEVTNIALVGYTNAGKSSLLNALTGSEQYVEDMLFATLDPLSKKLTLKDDRPAVLTDTVGFIRKLPHHLVEAFKSTLEVCTTADLLLHVMDATDPNLSNHKKTVENLLKDLGAEAKPILSVYNKADSLSEEFISEKDSILISAKTGFQLEELMQKITDMTRTTEVEKVVKIPYDKSHLVARIHENLKVLDISYENEYQVLTVYGKEELIAPYEQL
ncbi:MAG: GTPase HflX [Clostridia bacterium]|nr:GTPase HflX [Clostridia bacterium]